MKKNLIITAILGAASVFTAGAEVLAPYTEQFENPVARPRGWLAVASSSYAAPTYTLHDSGGHSGGYITVKQYSNTFSSYYKNYTYTGVLSTPKVSGKVSIWVRANGTSPSLTFFKLTSQSVLPSTYSAPTLIDGTAINMVEDKTLDDWTEITFDAPADSYIGIRAHNLDLDEFTAASADVVYRASLAVTDITNKSGGTKLEANMENKVTVKFSVTLTNDGDIDLLPSDDGFKIQLVNSTYDDKVFGTGKITDGIAWGQSITKDFEMTGTPEVKPGTVANSYQVWISQGDGDPVKGSLGSFTMIPYAPEATLMLLEDNDKNANSYTSVNATDALTVGIGAAGSTSRTFTMWNSGTAPLEVTSTSITGDFTKDTDAFTLQSKEKKNITIGLSGNPGLKEGKLTFATNLGDVTFDVLGGVTAASGFHEDFEGDANPAGWIFANNWKVANANANLKHQAGEKYAEQSYTAQKYKLITPLLSFAEGEKLLFMATKTDNLSSELRVYTSPDRVNWTEVKFINAKEDTEASCRFGVDKPTGSGYGTYEMKVFAADMPAGNTYVAFEAGGVRLDNVAGGKIVDVDHDIYVTDVSIPDVASVNTRFITSVSFYNLLTEPEKDYAVILEVDGKEVGRADETPELATGVPASFDIRYTPHEEGECKGELVFVSGQDRVVLNSFDFTVGPEKAEATYQVGTKKITTSDPFNIYYNACQAQIIYDKTTLGIDEGMKLTGVYFIGYNNTDNRKHIKVWAQNTTDEGYDLSAIVPSDAKDMTLVYEGDYDFKVCGNYGQEIWDPTLKIEFAEPFTYTGASLRLMVEQTILEEGAPQSHVFFAVDNTRKIETGTDDNRVIANRKEYVEDLYDEPQWNAYVYGLPVAFFSVAKEVVTLAGTVTDDFGAAVAGASVRIDSDDIRYSALTGEDGKYSMNIANVGLSYVLTAEADGFDTVTENDLSFSPAEPVVTKDLELNYTDRSATLSGRVTNTLMNCLGFEGVTVKVGDVSATTDANGDYTLTVPDFTKEYDLIAAYDAEQLYKGTVKFASKTETRDIEVAYSGLAAVRADAAVAVTVRGREISVDAPAGMALQVFNASGMAVASAVSDGTTVVFGPLAPGLYMVGGAKVVVR